MAITTQIDDDIKNAMRAKETARLSVLRMLKSSLKYAAIEAGGSGTELSDDVAISVLRKEVKKRQDSVAGYESGGRQDLADKEKAEIEMLSAYLPAAMSVDDVSALVRESISEAGATTRQQMGAVMKLANAKAAGRIDGKTLSSEVQKQLP